MIGYIYKTTNLITNKFYIGKRQKSTFDKYYYGSGKYLSASIVKYGKENFKREIIEWCDSIEELNNREKYWISHLEARNPKIGYNISEGGDGGKGGKLNGLYCYVHNESGYIRILKTDKDVYLNNGYLSGKGYGGNGLVGTKKSEETKKKMSESGRGKHNHTGENNPCFGVTYMWITDGKSNKRLSLNEDIPMGWERGKTQKKPKRTEKLNNYLDKLKTDGHWEGDKNPSRVNNFHWYTNGEQNVHKTKCPPGFYPGKSNVGKWYNNGIKEIQVRTNEDIPRGYIKGRLKHGRKIN